MKARWYILLWFLTFMAWVDCLTAQTYRIEPNDTIEKTGVFNDLETLSILQQNSTSKDTLHFKWKKVSEQVPNGWEASVCDNANCFTSLLDSGVMNPVLPGEYGLVLLHITPRVNFGVLIVRYAVWNVKSPEHKDTLTYILRVNLSSNTQLISTVPSFSVMPNPARELLTIKMNAEGNHRLMIFDHNGTLVKKQLLQDSLSIDIRNWSSGIYFISITTNNAIQTIKICIQ